MRGGGRGGVGGGGTKAQFEKLSFHHTRGKTATDPPPTRKEEEQKSLSRRGGRLSRSNPRATPGKNK